VQAALDLADAGVKVYLVEKSPSLGGRMAQLDKTFPTNDCSMCILSPKLVDVARHPNVELMTYSELKGLEGEPGSFKATVLKKARFITEDCTGCGKCSEACPAEFPNDFDLGHAIRKATYVPFPQAVPLRYTIHKKGTQPCIDACPAGVGACGYITLVARGKFYEALQLIKQKLPFPSICGRICHRPCEKVCARNDLDETVQIAHIKRFVGDLEMKVPFSETPPIDTRSEKIAIVGAGPAGLTAAHDLALKGYHVRIIEASPVLGGMMRFAIPRFRLPKDILDKEIQAIINLGVSVQLNTVFGKDLTIKELFDRGYDAIFLAVGAQKGKLMRIPGEELDGVYQAIDYLKEVTLGKVITTPIAMVDEEKCVGCGACYGSCMWRAIRLEPDKEDARKKKPVVLRYKCKGCGKCAEVCPTKAITLTGYQAIAPKLGNRVVVIGGGNAALDTARTAIRMGSGDVSILYRRSRDEMPAEPEWEIDETEMEGVKIRYLSAPIRCIDDGNGRVQALECIMMKLGEPDESGRRRPEPIPDSEYMLKVDSVIMAVGQEVDPHYAKKGTKMELNRWGTFKVDPVTYETNVKGVFSGGDAVMGSGTVIEAVAHGKEVAESIHRMLNGMDMHEGRKETRQVVRAPVEGLKKRKMVKMRYLDLEKRKNNFDEVELGYTEEEAMKEAARCLVCGGCAECMECERACEAGAVKHDMKDELAEIDVASVVVATGFETYDVANRPEYGYDKFQNVVTALEFERFLNAAGPFAGHLVRPSDHKTPKKIAFIQCVGSRDRKCHEYCSRVCCMYSIKEAMIAREHEPGLETTIYYMDIRAFGRGFQEYYDRARDDGIKFVAGRAAHVQEGNDGRLAVVAEDARTGELTAEEYDIVVLANAMIPNADNPEMAGILGVDTDEHGFFKSVEPSGIESTRPGVYLAGCIGGPRDIPDSVTQASGAAAKALALAPPSAEVSIKELPMNVADEVRVGVFVCHCGSNIAGTVDVADVAEYAAGLDGVVYADHTLFTCSDITQKNIGEIIQKENLTRVVIASCSPRTHEPIFRDTCAKAGLNPYLFEMANIRDQCSWVHMGEKEKATEKAKDLVRMAIARAIELEPLQIEPKNVVQAALVIGGGVAGMTAAIDLKQQGFETLLVEKNKLGGMLNNVGSLSIGIEASELVGNLKGRMETLGVKTVIGYVVEVEGSVGDYKVTLSDGTVYDCGTIILATGGDAHKPGILGYGQHPNVMTSVELEGKMDQVSGNVGFVQCVGANDETNPGCSRFCCLVAVKQALALAEKGAKPFVFYKDMRTFQKGAEEMYKLAAEKGVVFIQYNTRPTFDGKILVTQDGERLSIPLDYLVLSVGMVAPEIEALRHILKVPKGADGFFLEKHPKLGPVETNTDGIFVAGCANGPKELPLSLASAHGAAGKASGLLSRRVIYSEPVASDVDQDKCVGCGVCVNVCPYGALSLDEAGKAVSNAMLCKGCGVCAATCPHMAITVFHFGNDQINAQIASFAGGVKRE